MRKAPKAMVVAGLLGIAFGSGIARAQTPASAAPAAAQAEPPANTFAVKLGLWTEYEYRGISQSSEKPAVQLNLDYSHASGFYLGTFLSNIQWLKDTAEVNGFSSSANVEWDIYGGYKYEFIKDWTLDVGYLRYEYPSSSDFNPKPNTDEVYVGVSTGPWSAKYSYSFNNTFGVPDSKGSDYIEVDFNQPLAFISDKLTFNGVVGHQRYKGTQIHSGLHNGDLSYSLWKAGATWDFGGGWNAGGYVKGTDAHHDLYTVKGKDWSKTRAVGFVTYTF